MAHLDHTPRGHASRYVDSCYSGMRDDVDRTEAYRRAIVEAVRGKVVVDLGTGALALLAIIAAKAGATHVYAIEVQASAAKSARRAVEDAGLSESITVLHGFSTDADVVLPTKADIMVHELIGEIAGEEGVVAAVVDSLRRHMAEPSAPPISIPARTRSLIAPCEYPDEAYCARLPAALLETPGCARALKLPALPMTTRLSPPQTFEDLRFELGAPAASQAHDLRFVASRAGRLRGVAVHIELFAGAGAGDAEADVSSAWEGSHWRTILLLLDDEVAVEEGQKMVVRTSAKLAGAQPQYWFEVLLEEEEGGVLRPLAPARMSYPEAALNVNDSMDALLDCFAP